MTSAGKGDRYRKVDKKKYDANYERIYKKKKKGKQKCNIAKSASLQTLDQG